MSPMNHNQPSALYRLDPFFGILRSVILVFAFVAGGAIFVMIVTTVIDIILRIFRSGIVGAYDVVRICGVVSITCGLPYITAVKGHIAIEFFYQRFSHRGRVLLDAFFRIIAIALFSFLFYKNIEYGISLHETGELMPTLGIAVFWIPFLISLNSLLVVLTIVYHLLHPGKEMIEP